MDLWTAACESERWTGACADSGALVCPNSIPSSFIVKAYSKESGLPLYDAVEENRKRNEAKRAAQSARNAEIVAAFEARSAAEHHG